MRPTLLIHGRMRREKRLFTIRMNSAAQSLCSGCRAHHVAVKMRDYLHGACRLPWKQSPRWRFLCRGFTEGQLSEETCGRVRGAG